MEKVYKVKLHRIILNAIFGIFAAVFAFFVSGFWLDFFTCLAIAVVVFILYVWVVILGNFITVTVTDQYLMVKTRKEEKYYEIESSSFYAKRTVTNGDSSNELTIEDKDGNIETIDLELIGTSQFYSLIDDLGITGEKSFVQKIETRKK